ncbi:hypothetical protein D9757_000470 [Collybiopsis confluens]|uniref:Enoyl-CoA hydratase n=1 Tax=Collybiopsis confluens TaxID=2823264 RepID=A0A8H5I1Q5_9AGAR|nr:hypothetical protein D9757_000470 [Collybiopsis confluens]
MTVSYTPPAHSEQLLVSFPAEHVLLLTMNRPKSRNAMTPQMQKDLQNVLDWFSQEAGLWRRETVLWNKDQQTGQRSEQERAVANVHGFGSISQRQLTKPIIAAVNGGAHGGGTEIVLNCDIVVAGSDAKFALPEVKRGVVAGAGGIPRLSQIAGHHLAAEMLLTGKVISAEDAHMRFGFVNAVVPPSEILPEALRYAQLIVANSPMLFNVQNTVFSWLSN